MMIDVRTGDFVQLISLDELRKEHPDTYFGYGCAETESNYYTDWMCEAMMSSGMYKVNSVNKEEDEVYIDINGCEFIFSFSDIKHVYRIGLTKIM